MSGVIDLLAWKARRAGWQVLDEKQIDCKAYPNGDGRAKVQFILGDDTEELLLTPATLRKWAAKFLVVADQTEDAEMAAILAMEDA